VFSELESETFLCIRNPLHGGQRHLELAIADGADSNGGDLTEPFDHSKIAFRHGPPFWRQRRLSFCLDAPFRRWAGKISEPVEWFDTVHTVRGTETAHLIREHHVGSGRCFGQARATRLTKPFKLGLAEYLAPMRN
jgi:hypothetical protein